MAAAKCLECGTEFDTGEYGNTCPNCYPQKD